MKLTKFALTFLAANLLTGWVSPMPAMAQPDPDWLVHDRNRPQPPVVTPGNLSCPDQPGQPPSDAVVLFDGKDLTNWVSVDDNPAKWICRDGYMECVKGTGDIRTLQNFGDCQLHVEWATPIPPHGEGQHRGNSGVFFGLNRYEIQILDSFDNHTYADGSAGAIYGQYPPLVNACRPAGQWQTYDIIHTAPRFDAEGKLISPARITLFHNGVLVQNNVILTGPTGWLERKPYQTHPAKQPISLQDHGDPVRFRNIWVRELGKATKKEFTLPATLLDAYVGTFDDIEIAREDSQLILRVKGTGVKLLMFAESSTHFFAKTTDVQIEFLGGDQQRSARLIWSNGGHSYEVKRNR